jgi:hypothetical protein
MNLTAEQQKLDAKLWWTTVRPWLAHMTSWPNQPWPGPHTMTLWKCQQCGKSVATGQKLCTKCKKLQAQPTPPPKDPKDTKRPAAAHDTSPKRRVW